MPLSADARLRSSGEPDPLLVLARMWLRSDGRDGAQTAGRSIVRYREWGRRQNVDLLPLTRSMLERHLEWLAVSFSARTVEAAERDLRRFGAWLYEPLVEAAR